MQAQDNHNNQTTRTAGFSLSFNKPIFFADGNLDQTQARNRVERRLYKQAKRDLKVEEIV